MEYSLPSMLQALKEVDFILVGGLAAAIQGAPIQTYDVDIVFSQDAGNLSRLMTVLESLDAMFRVQPSRKIKPNMSHLAGSGHLNLQTIHGPLDLLTTIGDNLRYQDLLDQSKPLLVGQGLVIKVLGLRTLIAIKEQLGGEKDLAMLPILRRTLIESEKISYLIGAK